MVVHDAERSLLAGATREGFMEEMVLKRIQLNSGCNVLELLILNF